MGKDDFGKAVLAIGSIWLAAEVIKALSTPLYDCPVCQTKVHKFTARCPNCGTELRWQ